MAIEDEVKELRREVSARYGEERHFVRRSDPTPNVQSLVAAVEKAHTDLREADNRYHDRVAKNLQEQNTFSHAHLKEMADLRANVGENQRKSDLATLDKTRQVDVSAAATAAAGLASAVATLATTAAQNADNLRNQLNASNAASAKLMTDTAAQIATQTDTIVRGINDRIAELQKASYQGAGRQSVADPQMEKFVERLERISTAQERGGGKSEGFNTAWAIVVAIVGIGIAIYTKLP